MVFFFINSEILNNKYSENLEYLKIKWDEFKNKIRDTGINIELMYYKSSCEDLHKLYNDIANSVTNLLERPIDEDKIPNKDDNFILPSFELSHEEKNIDNILIFDTALEDNYENESSDIYIKETNVLKNITNRKIYRLNDNFYKDKLSKIINNDIKDDKIKTEIHSFAKKYIQNNILKVNKTIIEKIFKPNESCQKVLSTSETSIDIPTFIMNLINPSIYPMFNMEEKSSMIRKYSVSLVLDTSSSCFNPLCSSFSLQSLRAILSILNAIDLPCFDFILSRQISPKILCSNLSIDKAINSKSILWESLIPILAHPCSKSDLASAIEAAFDIKRMRASELTNNYLFILTDGLYQENEYKRILRAVNNCAKSGYNIFGIGIGTYPIRIEQLFPKVIYCQNPYNLSKAISNLFGEPIYRVKDSMTFMDREELNDIKKLNDKIAEIIDKSTKLKHSYEKLNKKTIEYIELIKKYELSQHKFTVQFFGKNMIINISDKEKLSLNELKCMIIKLFNFKKIGSNNIILFYRELNRISYNIIDSDNLNNIMNKKNIIIKVKIVPEILPTEKNELTKFYSNLITSIEIEDILLDEQKLKEKANDIINFGKENNKDYINKKIPLNCRKKNTEEEEMLIINLFSEILGKRGINILIEKDNEYNGINSKKALQNISAGLFDKKKFELHFEKDNNLLLLKEPEEYYFFTEELRKSLTKHLQINPETIIFGPPKKGSVIVPVVFLKESIKHLNLEKIKNENPDLGDLTEINKLPLMKYIKLDQNIFDSRFNNENNNEWGRNERRGKEKYIPPIGWKGYGLNVEDSYDGGEACWLCFAGIYENEFAVAYYPITEEDTDIFLDIEIIENLEFPNLIANSINSRSERREEKTGEGIIVFQNIKIAENQASFIEGEYFYFKIVIMCRVRPDRIRAPEDYKDVWILNPNSDEIRPYRILVKLYPKNSKDPSSPKNFYKFYNISEIFNECLEKKDKTIYENMDYRGNRNEYPIYLYTQNSEHLTNYLLFKKIDNGYTKEKLQSWAWCLYK